MTGAKESVETDTEKHAEVVVVSDEEVETEAVEDLDKEIVTLADLDKDDGTEVLEKHLSSHKDSEKRCYRGEESV